MRKIPNSMLSLRQLRALYLKDNPDAKDHDIALYAISVSANYKSKGYFAILEELKSFEENPDV